MIIRIYDVYLFRYIDSDIAMTKIGNLHLRVKKEIICKKINYYYKCHYFKLSRQ